jgi:sorbitol/mannitol transport system permease protein
MRVGQSLWSRIALTISAWFVAFIMFFPILWMVLISFRDEVDAAASPPIFFAEFTTERYQEVFSRGIGQYLTNSIIAAGVSTVLVLVLAFPAAYALTIKPVRAWGDVLTFFLSTKFLPAIAALLPLYLIVKQLGMLDNILTLVVLYLAMNLPLAVWMLRSFLSEVPREIIEAAEMDGCGTTRMFLRILLPMTLPGLGATALIAFIFAWNEFLLAVNLTATQAATSPVYLVGFITSEGLFLASLSAVAVVVSLPVVIAGWLAQGQLVRGLSLGAVK